MEILSDTVFHGDVSIGTSTNPKTLKLYTNGNGNVLTIGETGGTEILKTDGIVKFEDINARYANICSLTISGNDSTLSIGFWSISDQYPSFYQSQTKNHFYFGERGIGKTYYIATQDQIPSMDGVAHFCSIQINFDVAADCTRFYVGRTPNLPYGPASLQMFTDRLPNGGTGYYLKNVDLGVEKIDMGNPYIFVEKSSSFAISASDGYSVRIVY